MASIYVFFNTDSLKERAPHFKLAHLIELHFLANGGESLSYINSLRICGCITH